MVKKLPDLRPSALAPASHQTRRVVVAARLAAGFPHEQDAVECGGDHWKDLCSFSAKRSTRRTERNDEGRSSLGTDAP